MLKICLQPGDLQIRCLLFVFIFFDISIHEFPGHKKPHGRRNIVHAADTYQL